MHPQFRAPDILDLFEKVFNIVFFIIVGQVNPLDSHDDTSWLLFFPELCQTFCFSFLLEKGKPRESSPSAGRPGTVSPGGIAPAGSLSRGFPSSHTRTSGAEGDPPVEVDRCRRGVDFRHLWGSSPAGGLQQTHHRRFSILGEDELSDPLFLLRLDAASSEQPVRPARCPGFAAESPAHGAHLLSLFTWVFLIDN